MRAIPLLAMLACAMSAHAAPFEWTAYGGDGRGQRHAPLSQITPQNVGNLELAWSFRTGELGQGFERGTGWSAGIDRGGERQLRHGRRCARRARRVRHFRRTARKSR